MGLHFIILDTVYSAASSCIASIVQQYVSRIRQDTSRELLIPLPSSLAHPFKGLDPSPETRLYRE